MEQSKGNGTIQSILDSYIKKCVDARASKYQVIETRIAFMAGIKTSISFFTNVTALPEDVAIAKVDEYIKECKEMVTKYLERENLK